LGAFLGRRSLSVGTIGKAGSAMRSAGRAAQQAGDVARAAETVKAVQGQIEALDAQFQAEIAALEARQGTAGGVLEPLRVRPRKSHLTVKLVALAWVPHQPDASGALLPAW